MVIARNGFLKIGLLGILLAHYGFAVVLRLPLNSITVCQELKSLRTEELEPHFHTEYQLPPPD